MFELDNLPPPTPAMFYKITMLTKNDSIKSIK